MSWWQSVLGVLVGGGLTLLASWQATVRAAKNSREQSDRDDLRRLAAALVRECDLLRGADGARVRALIALMNAESAARDGAADNGWHATNQRAMREQLGRATEDYAAANDRVRGLVGEMRVSHPELAHAAEVFYRASTVPQHPEQQATFTASMDYAPFEAAEKVFIAAVRQALDE